MIDELAYAMNMFYSMESMPFFKPKELLGMVDVFKMLKSVRSILALFKKYRKTTIDSHTCSKTPYCTKPYSQ